MKRKISTIVGLGILIFFTMPFVAMFYISYADSIRPVPTQPTTTNVQPIQTRVYTTNELLAEANKLRAEKGVAPLKLDERLNQSAQWKADDMLEHQYYGHARDGYHGYEKIQELAPECGLSVSENLQWYNTGRSPFEWWITSEPHYEAIINEHYKLTGFGHVVQPDGTNTYVQHFCNI